MSLIELDDGVVAGAYGEIAYAEGWSLELVLEAAVSIVRADEAVRQAISQNGIGLHGCFCASRRILADNDERTLAQFIGSGPGPSLGDLSPMTQGLLNALALTSDMREEPPLAAHPGRPLNGPRIAISWYPLTGEGAIAAERNAMLMRARDQEAIVRLRRAAAAMGVLWTEDGTQA